MELRIINTKNNKSVKIQETSVKSKMPNFFSFTTESDHKVKKIIMISSLFALLLVLIVLFVVWYFVAQPVGHSQRQNTAKDEDRKRKFQNCSLQSKILCHEFNQSWSVSMDFSADPCEDFHQYICGNWPQIKPNPIDKIVKTTVVEFGRIFAAGINNSTSKAVHYLMDLYEEYSNGSQREQLGQLEPARHLLKQIIGHDQWPLIANYSALIFSHKNSTKFFDFLKTDYSSRISIIVDFSEFEKIWKSWKFLLSNKSTPFLPDDQLIVAQWMDCYVEASMIGVHSLIDDMMSLDKQTWNRTITIVLSSVDYDDSSDEDEDIDDLFHKYSEIALLIMNLEPYGQWNTSVDFAIFEMLHFNLTLSKTLKSKSIEWFELSPNKRKSIKLSELNELHSSFAFDWTLLMNKFMNRTGSSFRYTDKDSVFINSDQLAEFKPFTELIASTPIQVLKNFVALQVLREPSIKRLLFNVPINLERIFPANQSSISEQQKQFLIRIKNFMSVRFVEEMIANKHFLPVLTRLFIEKVGREPMRAARDQVILLTNQIKETFRGSLKYGHNWLDSETRQNTLDKLENMKSMIAFPDWILDDEALDEEFGFSQMSIDSQSIIKGQYAASYLNALRLKNSAMFRRMHQILLENRLFLFAPIGITAGYLPQLNTIVLEPPQLLNPLIFVDSVSALIYGNLGFTIGHEISHGFSGRGALYDRTGEKANWGTDSARENFEKKAKCFVEQYDGLVEPITGVKINGTFTLGENISDNGGLNLAYQTFSATLKNNSHGDQACPLTCPSFQTQFTPEQLFFISYGTIWCSKHENSTALAQHIQADSHSPARLRVNVPLSNMAQFSRAFNCSVGSKMNPQNKCTIW